MVSGSEAFPANHQLCLVYCRLRQVPDLISVILPDSPRAERSNVFGSPDFDVSPAAPKTSGLTKTKKKHSLVENATPASGRQGGAAPLSSADSPLATQSVPGALHLADDTHIQRLISRHGALTLVRQIATDLAQRDAQIAALRRRADNRERALRKIVLECGLSTMDMETRLRSIESDMRSNGLATTGGPLSDLMSDAMQNTVNVDAFGLTTVPDATIRASSLFVANQDGSKTATKGWKEFFWGSSTNKRPSRSSSTSGDAAAAPTAPGSPGPNLASTGARPSKMTCLARQGPTQPRTGATGLLEAPGSARLAQQESYGPVEMDTILPPETQPPTLTQHTYNAHGETGFLTDRFGFIYDQRRKKRQRDAAKVSRYMKTSRGEMLNGRSTPLSPVASTSAEQATSPSRRVRLRLQSNPGLLTSDDRGFVPTANPTSAIDSGDTIPVAVPPTSTAAISQADPDVAKAPKEDTEPVKLLLQQLNDVHDSLQRDKTVRWNDFLRKVRAERPVILPEAKLTDGEMIGISGLGNKGKVGRAKWNEFKSLVLGGIPVAYRSKVWSECSGASALRIPGYYDDLIAQPTTEDDATVVAQIEMDINRTLTDNIFFRKGPGVARLNEVLLAYARRNREVGYCQGMNLITANLLLIMPSAEDAFWILTSIVETILPQGYYDHSLLTSRADQQVLRRYVREILPRLSQHLDELGVELEALTFQWFLSVFTDCLSAEALFRVWDVVLCTNDGSTFLFQVALALLKLNESQLLQCEQPAAVYTYINHQMTNHAISIDGLVHASEGLRRFVKREEVEARRSEAVRIEKEVMREREEMRSGKMAGRRKASQAAAPAEDTDAASTDAPTAGTGSSAMS
ncbi:unnamed protein product [Parascedosporium putredinis]|uniref:Rab-GAP TBC domain-containing protein n=1 Tax=Parascedosporium putredinis TaxID=1442378 RepID=A0A9P1H5Y2_9PEZI|nr:unnamed protein product [Parascedosporium putredinis]CAI7999740.1 unnamed protein product [Parascedosporium putredinis]